MARIKCPYCDNPFEWTKDMGEGRIQCPMCAKTLKVQRRTGTKNGATNADIERMTDWGTQGGFQGEDAKDEYGEIRSGDQLGGFRIESMLGAGAMAVVYEATQLSLGRRVALKILPRRFAERESFVRQFDSETELLASLNHPNIVTIIDRGREGDTYFFAMELITGTTLGELVAADKMEIDFFLQIMEQCGEALSYAHSKGIIHRDIKPANIMLNEQGVVKVADFGVAGLVAEERVEGKRRVMGTRGYMPPEQEVSVERTDERSDIFSLGAVMYRVLTNRIPEQLPPRAPSKVDPEVDRRLDHIVLKCLETNPDRRYQTAKELLDALKAFHRELSRAHEVCPKCKKANPPSQVECLHCGADLSELFDACPECGSQNRLDMDMCMSCGASLTSIRQETSVAISQAEERARNHAARHRYSQAVEELKEVLEVKGKIFRKARERAARQIEEYQGAEKNYNLDIIKRGKKLAEDGKLDQAISTLQSVSDEVAEEEGVGKLVVDIKCRQMLAKEKVGQIEGLLRERKMDRAEALFQEVQGMWPECPGMEEAGRQLKASRDTQKMLEYELQEVRRLLEQGKVDEARAAIQFAQSASPDHPAVKELAEAIERNAKTGAFLEIIRRGREAFDMGDYAAAVRDWTEAAELLPEDDGRLVKLRESISVARKNMLDHDVIKLHEAEPVRLGVARGPLVGALLALGICAAAALVVAGVSMIGAQMALAGARPGFAVAMKFSEQGVLFTNFMGWQEGALPTSLRVTGSKDPPADVQILQSPEGVSFESPSGTGLLHIRGWNDASVTLSEHTDTTYGTVSTVAARGGSNGHDRLGVLLHCTGPDSYVRACIVSGKNLEVLVTDGSRHDWKKTVPLSGGAGPGSGQAQGTAPMAFGRFWTITLRTAPGEQDGRMLIAVRVQDENGRDRVTETRDGKLQGAEVVFADAPQPEGGLAGAPGLHGGVAEGGDQGDDTGLWFDSIEVRR